MKKYLIFVFIFASSILLSSCDGVISGIGNLMCSLAPDTDHCYQFSAVQGGNPDKCAKIKGTKFKGTGSNPPRDKCYLQIAVNKGDYNVCKKIVGGPMSYTYEGCVLETAIKKDDPKGCSKLTSFPSEYASCKSNLVSLTKVNEKDSQIENLIKKLKSDPDNSDLKKQLAEAKVKQDSIYKELSDGEKQQYFKEKREVILSGVEDEDVKSAISKSYTNFRSANPDMKIGDLVDKLKTIKDEQEQIKRIDDYSNELTDKIKEQMQSVVDGKKDELIDAAGEKAKDWLQKNGGDNVKWGLKNLEWMRDKYEKGSAKYNELQEKYAKLKGYYDEVMGVYNKVDEINTMVANGKITEGQARAIKGGVFLQKGLEYSTKYVPVFGSTISKISKETFEMVVNKAKERAERTNSMQKCIDDPANCDPSGISAY